MERKEQTPALSPFATWGHGEKAAVCKPREASGWNLCGQHFDLALPASITGRSQFLLFKRPVLGVLLRQPGQNKTIMMTLANTVEHLLCARDYFRKLKEIPRLPWPSSGEDPMLLMQGGAGLISGRGTKISQGMQWSKKKKKKTKKFLLWWSSYSSKCITW